MPNRYLEVPASFQAFPPVRQCLRDAPWPLRSRFRFRSSSATWYSEVASLASTRSDAEGSEGPSSLILLRPPVLDAPRGSRV